MDERISKKVQEYFNKKKQDKLQKQFKEDPKKSLPKLEDPNGNDFFKQVKKLYKVKATGEMSQHDLEKGGEWYESRLELEDLCKKSGLKCKVKPFDKYQGPYALIDDNSHDYDYPVKIWFNEGDIYPRENYLLDCKDLDTENKTIPFNTPQELKKLMGKGKKKSFVNSIKDIMSKIADKKTQEMVEVCEKAGLKCVARNDDEGFPFVSVGKAKIYPKNQKGEFNIFIENKGYVPFKDSEELKKLIK